MIAYASRHGSTAGIAERIAAGLCAAGLAAEARPVGAVAEVGAYDAFVIGAAAYMFHWLKDATRFVEQHRDLLARRPVSHSQADDCSNPPIPTSGVVPGRSRS